ncbi:uncharacterized protein LOC135493569 [Lineus longissimus]|uniref:uncharacterized protein LOC135493569 n=1 Tax=Lineus longissimus TaxID=88925 RepID=UPI00315CF7C1
MGVDGVDEVARPESNEGNECATGGEACAKRAPRATLEDLKARRKVLRGKVMRTINRLSGKMAGNDISKSRLEKEMVVLKQDFTEVCSVNADMFSYPGVDEDRLSDWEEQITDSFYDFVEKTENYVCSSPSDHQVTQPVTEERSAETNTGGQTAKVAVQDASRDSPIVQGSDVVSDASSTSTSLENVDSNISNISVNVVNFDSSTGVTTSRPNISMSGPHHAFDSWVDQLIEFQETSFPISSREVSVADALYRLEASRDVPTRQLSKFNGNSLNYVDFIDSFKIHIHDKRHLTDDSRMMQLRMHLTDEAERAIVGQGTSGMMYHTALKMLKEQFGSKSIIARGCIDRLVKGPKVLDRKAIRDFSLDIVNCLATLNRINYLADVHASESLRQIVRRLPDHMIHKWKTTAAILRERDTLPNLAHISDFVRKRVKADFDPDFGDLACDKSDGKVTKVDRKGVHSAQFSGPKKPRKCYVCESDHRVSECPMFSDSSVADRLKIVKDQRLCFGCLNRGHRFGECNSKKKCGKNNCSKTHHPLIHTDPPTSGAVSTLDRDGILPVVRVKFRSEDGRIREGNVLIDSGAATTIIRKDFARALGLQGKEEGGGGGDQLNQTNSRRLKFWIAPLTGGEEHEIEAHEINRTIVSIRPWLSSFSHLSDLKFTHKAGPVDLILGIQYSHLHVEQEIRQGLPFEPVGKRTMLGWFVIGPDKSVDSITSISFVRKENPDVSRLYNFETIGVRAPNCDCPEDMMSREDKKAMDMFASSCHKDGDRYVIGLPWKKDPSLLPDNRVLAEKRLASLERSLAKTPEKAVMYDKVISQYLENGWAVQVDEDEPVTGPLYYLPHHGIYRPEKISTPLRVVFDPACLFEGVSLNSFLLKGPNLMGNLLAVLIRFREDLVAIVDDISKMFLQVKLKPEDTEVHRFLWRNLDSTREPDVYRMTRVTFGDKPSPDMASFVILEIAEKFQDIHPEAAWILRNDRYMDDLIHSCPSTEDATTRMMDIDESLNDWKFKVKEWYCSAPSSVQKTTSNDQQSAPNINLSGEDVKTLGVLWDPVADVITFKVKEKQMQTITKRSVLSRLSMLFDPLGLATPVTIRAKVAMQAIWRLDNLGWNDELPPDYTELWTKLFQDFKELEKVQLPRCVKPKGAIGGSSELHVFGDASFTAYGAVAYMRWNTLTGPTSVRLYAAKARVAPLRQTTIPRLELMAALVTSRLAKTIHTELREKPEVHLWSDSKIVLHWIKSNSIDLKPFVGVRVAEIQSTWEPELWNHVPTEQNPADDLSRGLEASEMVGRLWQAVRQIIKKT